MKTIRSKSRAFMNVWISIATAIIVVIICCGAAIGIAMAAKRNQSAAEPSNAAVGGIGGNFAFSGDICIAGPDVSQAVRTEKRKFYVTAYCPPSTGYDTMEGGQTTSSGINVGLGSVAVPPFNKNNPDITSSTPDYPWGTTFDIPGYGRGVAMDHGCAIQKAGQPDTCKTSNYPVTKYDHLDIFVGNGQEACSKWQTKEVEATVYWFDPKAYDPHKASNFIKSGQCASSNKSICSDKIIEIAQKEIGQTATGDCNKYHPGCHAWCAAFATWVYKQAGLMKHTIEGTLDLRKNTSELEIITVKNNVNNIKPGDIFWVNSHGQSASGFHVGIVESIASDGVHTIEGNVDRQGNVDRVARRVKPVSEILTVARSKLCK